MPDIFKDEFPERELPNGRAMIQFKCYVDERLELLRKEQLWMLKTLVSAMKDYAEIIREAAAASNRGRVPSDPDAK